MTDEKHLTERQATILRERLHLLRRFAETRQWQGALYVGVSYEDKLRELTVWADENAILREDNAARREMLRRVTDELQRHLESEFNRDIRHADEEPDLVDEARALLGMQ